MVDSGMVGEAVAGGEDDVVEFAAAAAGYVCSSRDLARSIRAGCDDEMMTCAPCSVLARFRDGVPQPRTAADDEDAFVGELGGVFLGVGGGGHGWGGGVRGEGDREEFGGDCGRVWVNVMGDGPHGSSITQSQSYAILQSKVSVLYLNCTGRS